MNGWKKSLKDLVELEFVQQEAQKKMHVTSNPYFAFHDDVLPTFAKNAVGQRRFPRPGSFNQKTVIPDNFFSSLAELKHISTLVMRLNEKDNFKFEISFSGKSRDFKKTKILECSLFDGTSFISFGINQNESLWMTSAYFNGRFILQSSVTDLEEVTFSIKSSVLKVSEEKLNLSPYFFLSKFLTKKVDERKEEQSVKNQDHGT